MMINGLNVCLLAVPRCGFNCGAVVPDARFHCLAGLASALLNSTQKLILFAVDQLKIVVSELSPLLFEVTLEYVPIAFDFEFVHS